MECSKNPLWEYHIKEKKKRAVPLRPSLEIETGIVIDKLLDENRKEVKVPAEIDGYPVNRIGKQAFMNCKQLESVELPESVLVIEAEAFAGCESLSKIKLPVNLRMMMHGIFRNCTALEEVEFPDGLKLISFETFQGCASLKKVKLPEELIGTGNHTFEDCVSLETIELPETVREIDIGTFIHCKSLKEIKIPRSVTKIGGWAFDGCSSLREIDLPEGITEICRYTFRNCHSLERIRIPAGVINMGSERLNWITALVEEDIGIVVQENPLEGCDNLKEICVCAGSYAEEWARENDYRSMLCIEELPLEYFLKEETQTAVITGLQKRDMDKLVIPGILESCLVVGIANEALAFCDNLTSVVLPETVQVIGEGAFRMCSNLHSLYLPASVRYIDDTVIVGCTELKKIYVKADSYAEKWAMECGLEVSYQ